LCQSLCLTRHIQGKTEVFLEMHNRDPGTDRGSLLTWEMLRPVLGVFLLDIPGTVESRLGWQQSQGVITAGVDEFTMMRLDDASDDMQGEIGQRPAHEETALFLTLAVTALAAELLAEFVGVCHQNGVIRWRLMLQAAFLHKN